MWGSDKWLLFLSWKVSVGSLLDNGGRLSSVDFAYGILLCLLGDYSQPSEYCVSRKCEAYRLGRYEFWKLW